MTILRSSNVTGAPVNQPTSPALLHPLRHPRQGAEHGLRLPDGGDGPVVGDQVAILTDQGQGGPNGKDKEEEEEGGGGDRGRRSHLDGAPCDSRVNSRDGESFELTKIVHYTAIFKQLWLRAIFTKLTSSKKC